MENAVTDIGKIAAILDNKAHCVVNLLKEKGLHISTAESCTGGMLSQYITSVAGASDIFEYGICSYSERIKHQELGVSSESLKTYGVVSEKVATEMAEGVSEKSGAEIGVGITGIAGPGGGTEKQPVGTVYVCVCYGNRIICKNLALYKKYERPDRNAVRMLAVLNALEMVETLIE